jgi:hypothetical protein
MTQAVDKPERECPADHIGWAHRVGETSNPNSSKIEPRPWPKRLLTALITRGNQGFIPSIAKQRLLRLDTTHACLVNPL